MDRIRLGNAPEVEKATASYRRESDHLSRFLGDRCITAPGYQTSGRELYEAYVEWCADKKEKPESNNVFAATLAEHGIGKKRSSKGAVYMGLGVRPQIKDAEPDRRKT